MSQDVCCSVLYSVKCSRFPLHWQVAKLFVKKHNLSNSPFLRFRILSPTRNYEIVLSPMHGAVAGCCNAGKHSSSSCCQARTPILSRFRLTITFLKLFDQCVIIKWQKSWTDFDEGCSKVGITAFRTYILEYLAGVQCIPKELLWWVQSFSDLLPPNIMCCGHQLNLQGSNSGKETTYDLGRAATRWKCFSEFQYQQYQAKVCIFFRWQVVVFYSGDWEEDSANAIKAFSSLAADFQWEKYLFSFNLFLNVFQAGRLLHLWLFHRWSRLPPCMVQVIDDWSRWLVQVRWLVIRWSGDQVVRWSGDWSRWSLSQ